MQDRKFDRGLIDNEVLKKLCSEKTEPKSALKKVESDLVEPNSDLARGPHSEGGTEACDVRSTFVAEVTYKQVVFPRGAEAGQAGQGERGGGGNLVILISSSLFRLLEKCFWSYFGFVQFSYCDFQERLLLYEINGIRIKNAADWKAERGCHIDIFVYRIEFHI